MQEQETRTYAPRQKSCELCGAVVGRFKVHQAWHEKRGEHIEQRPRASTGYCSHCGDKIEFNDGRWRHVTPGMENCGWVRTTNGRKSWNYCNRCGIKFHNADEADSHKCK